MMVLKYFWAILFSLGLSLPAYTQEPPSDIRFVFTDSTRQIIMPDIRVKSKYINNENLQFEGSKEFSLQMDSLPKYQFGPLYTRNQVFTIYSLIGSHWLDNEYTLFLSYAGKKMTIHMLTNGFSLADTIAFQEGNFVYLPSLLSGYESRFLFSKRVQQLVQLSAENPVDFCILRCTDIHLSPIDPEIEKIFLNTIHSYPDVLFINEFPIGIVAWEDHRLYCAYFSDDFLKLIKKDYF